MSSKARIKLSSTEPEALNSICEQIKGITSRTGVDIKGPVPLPTKKIRMATRRAISGEGRETYESWELRIHKRLIDIPMDERALRLILRLSIPKSVNMEMEITE